jgi:arginine decarboxylase
VYDSSVATPKPIRGPHRLPQLARERPGERFEDATVLYGIPHWGKRFFHVSEEGNLVVRPTREPDRGVALKQIVDEMSLRGITPPLIIRFPQILASAVSDLNNAFARAIEEFGYGNVYRGVFPIKVNQKRVVVEQIIAAGRPYGYGLEAGSKPELLAAIAADLAPESLIVCNGYKDDAFIGMALNGLRMKKKVVLVLEKVSELDRILAVAKQRRVRPLLGMRVKLYARGSGKWAKSGGEAAKFGLTTPEMLEAVKILKRRRMLDSMVMLHFHIGSQITDIRKIKDAIREAGRVYAKLRALGVSIKYLNLGGGLGVDYDGSKTAFDSSMNYSVQEYANDVVYTIKTICEEEGVPEPTLVTESGRAITAFHSVLITNVLDVADRIEQGRRVRVSAKDANVIQELAGILKDVNAKNLRESYHDALQYKEELFTLFNLGHLSLEDRSKGEMLFWQICERIHRDLKTLKEIPEEFEDMETMLADKYVLNFSVFQSLPDSWAIDQLFPILPIHRLNEKPTEFATLADITCDSDGKIERFIDLRDIDETLPLHPFRKDKPYYIGVCLMGAYQDVLGDLHNLFGEAHEVLVRVDSEGRSEIEDVLPGETCERVLEYMNYDRTHLLDAVREQLVRASGSGLKKSEVQAIYREFEGVLPRYTYLER